MKHFLLTPIASFLFITMAMSQETLKAEYYNGTNFEEKVGSNFVSKIDFYWDHEAPIEGLNPNECSVRYTGQIKSPRTGMIAFSARVDDGIRVWIDNTLVLSNWQLNNVGLAEGEIHLEADKSYNIRIDYFNALKEAEIQLLWQLPEDPNQSWLSKMWYGEDPIIISSEHFMPTKKEKKVSRA